jgi:hypothetical protein
MVNRNQWKQAEHACLRAMVAAVPVKWIMRLWYNCNGMWFVFARQNIDLFVETMLTSE